MPVRLLQRSQLIHHAGLGIGIFLGYKTSFQQVSKCLVQSLHALPAGNLYLAIQLVYSAFPDQIPDSVIGQHYFTGRYTACTVLTRNQKLAYNGYNNLGKFTPYLLLLPRRKHVYNAVNGLCSVNSMHSA